MKKNIVKGFPKELIELIENEYSNVAGIIVVENNEITYENYFKEYNQNDTIHIASVTKSILSILIGIAIDKGFINGIEQNVLDFFPEYKIKRGEKTIQKVTLRHLLTMTAPYKYKYEPYTAVYSSKDWTKATLDLLGGKTISGDFKYTTIGIQILSGVIIAATGKSVLDFAAENLFKPLGIKEPKSQRIHNKEEHFSFLKDEYVTGWVIDPKGVNTAGWGLTLTTRDISKIGLLYLNKGIWNKTQIVSSIWVEDSIKKHSQWGKLSYGYMWWIISEDKNNSFAAIGDGGNTIYVSPKEKIVISITSQFKPRAKDRIHLIEKKILPYLKRNDLAL